ncbi:MAG TPA: pyruvate kinase [Acidobacteriota bacterium]|nr:pyruvate kinase [Acidobacteriota bacterium]
MVKRSFGQGRRTKIVCTIGPATQERGQLEALIDAGMDVARLNFSHGEPEWHRRTVALIRAISAARNHPIGVMLDIPGPKLRLGEIPDGPIFLDSGSAVRLVAGDSPGDADEISVNYASLADELEPADRIFVGDGDVELEVESIHNNAVHCRVISGGPVSSHKGMNFPTRTLSLPTITPADREAIALGVTAGVDFVALSFVRSGADVELAHSVILEHGGNLPVIAKIEKHEAMQNLDEIIEQSDGLLVARGDLAVEIPLEEVPRAQKRIIRSANAAGKPVITATQMLRSMVSATRPTRAETTDVANALYDGTDAVMLSEETAVGSNPVGAVNIMRRICIATERDMERPEVDRKLPTERRDSVPHVVAAAAALVARLLDVAAILVPTRTGSTAIKMAEFRPRQPILAISTHPVTVGRLTLTWGVIPLLGNEVPTHEAMLAEAEATAREGELLHEGDLVVITAGFPVGGPGTTNTVTVKAIGEDLAVGGWDQRPLFADSSD